MAKVIVYSTQTCPFCIMAKDWLRQHKIDFQDFDVERDNEKLKEMIQKSGQTGVPVIDVDGKVIVGFNEQALRSALHL